MLLARLGCLLFLCAIWSCATDDWNSTSQGLHLGSFSPTSSASDPTVQRQQSLDLALTEGRTLILDAKHATVEVRAAEGPGRAEALFEFTGPDPQAMKRKLEEYSLAFEQSQGEARLKVTGEAFAPDEEQPDWQAYPSVHLRIEVPAGTPFHTSLSTGSVDVQGLRGGLELHTEFGQITLRRIGGAVRATSGSGSINASELEAQQLELQSDFGAIELRQVNCPMISLRTSSGGILVEGSRLADLQARSSFGGIRVDAHGSRGQFLLRATSGKVELMDAEGEAQLTTEFGPIHVQGRFSLLDAESDSGSIQASVAMIPGEEAWSLKTEFGSIDLNLQGDADASLQATSGFGKVRAEGPALESRQKGIEGGLQAQLGSGVRPVMIHSASGGVTLRHSEPAR